MIHQFKSIDCPDANGRTPQHGEHKWTLSIPLEGDDYLEVQCGPEARESFASMLGQENADDLAELERLRETIPTLHAEAAAMRTALRSLTHNARSILAVPKRCEAIGEQVVGWLTESIKLSDEARSGTAGTALLDEFDRLLEAVTPSGDTKAAYIGEFKFPEVDGNLYNEQMTVPWTTVKEIMKAIRERAGRE